MAGAPAAEEENVEYERRLERINLSRQMASSVLIAYHTCPLKAGTRLPSSKGSLKRKLSQ